VNKNSESKLVK